MNNLQAEVNQYTANQALKRQFVNLYRLIKTHTLIKNLYFTEAIPRDTYNRQIKESIQKINFLKKNLQKYDIRRFCQLWDITTEFQNLTEQKDLLASDIKVPISVARIANLLPRINDDTYSATTFGQIHQILSTFCLQLSKLKQTEQNLTPVFKKIIEDLISLQDRLSLKYQRLNDPLEEQQKQLLKQTLVKLRVEFQKIYRF